MFHASQGQVVERSLPGGILEMSNNYSRAQERKDRDTYFFDVVRECGFDINDPHDWVTIGLLTKELSLSGEVDSDALRA